MTHTSPQDESPIDGAPTWVRVLQAALIGLVAGLALHAIFSMVVLQGAGLNGGGAGRSECRKAVPARDAVAPSSVGPSVSEAVRRIDQERS